MWSNSPNLCQEKDVETSGEIFYIKKSAVRFYASSNSPTLYNDGCKENFYIDIGV